MPSFSFRRGAVLFFAFGLLGLGPIFAMTFAYVGTYTGPRSRGIYAFRVEDAASGQPRFISLGLVATTANPSFLTVDPARRVLFAVNETESFKGHHSGGVSSFAIDPATGSLTLLNQQASMGMAPCHLALDPSGRMLVVANYSGGNVAVLPVSPDGHLGEASAVEQHSGRSVNSSRQAGPHAHGVTFDPAGRFLLVCDLGLDRILAYRLDAVSGKLTAVEAGGASVKGGSGPRHLVFRPDGRFAYGVNELNSTVTVFAYTADSGRLAELQTLSTLPTGVVGGSFCAEIAVDPTGRWLYASNRGHDSIAEFEIDPAKGTLAWQGTTSSGGKTPRHFALLPGAATLVAANQGSDSLQLFSRDPGGALTAQSGPLAVPSPVCAVFVEFPDVR